MTQFPISSFIVNMRTRPNLNHIWKIENNFYFIIVKLKSNYCFLLLHTMDSDLLIFLICDHGTSLI